jgi:hypothetical protein
MSEPQKQVELPLTDAERGPAWEVQALLTRREAELETLRARVEELTAISDTSEWFGRAIAAESRLRAVSEYLNNIRGSAHYDHIITRLRAIVEGK